MNLIRAASAYIRRHPFHTFCWVVAAAILAVVIWLSFHPPADRAIPPPGLGHDGATISRSTQ